jgi:hypothetical protein
VCIASPDEHLRARVGAVVASLGHELTLEAQASFEALEASVEERVDVAILDESLSPTPGSAIAEVLRDVRSSVVTVVIHRGELSGHDALKVLNPLLEGFDEALANVLETAERRRGRRGF